MMKMTLICALAMTAWVHARCGVQDEVPPVFSELDFASAVAKTKDSEKILVVKATAAWCAPCKQMDRTTWRDEGVVAWFEKNGLAIQFDVDEVPELARQLAIEAMPTMIAFVKGEEFDRIVGYEDAGEFLEWVKGVARGEKAIEAVRARAQAALEGSKEQIDRRYALARDLARAGLLAEATEEFVWLWIASKDVPAYGGVRGSFMASEMERLAGRHPPARATFAGLRDKLTPRVESEKVELEDLDDWIVLNEVVGQDEKTLAWFDRVKGKARQEPLIRRVSFRLERLFAEEGRWEDVARLHPDPLVDLAETERRSELMIGQMGDTEQVRAQRERMLQQEAGKLYAAMLAAGREETADTLAREAVRLEDSAGMRVALVRAALVAEEPRARQTELLDAAVERDEHLSVDALREELAAALPARVERRAERDEDEAVLDLDGLIRSGYEALLDPEQPDPAEAVRRFDRALRALEEEYLRAKSGQVHALILDDPPRAEAEFAALVDRCAERIDEVLVYRLAYMMARVGHAERAAAMLEKGLRALGTPEDEIAKAKADMQRVSPRK